LGRVALQFLETIYLPHSIPMAETPENSTAAASNINANDINADELFKQLRRKEGTWVEWGKACQMLQKAGYNPQIIFEETGFEPTQQNQVMVAAQVYASIVSAGAAESVQRYFEGKGSDVLYELRILTHADRAAVAELAMDKSLDMDEAHEAAKAVKEFSRLGTVPDGFTDHPGDAIAHSVWKLARQKSDLQERSRLIAKGLRFAHSNTARKQIEQLLTDFTVVPAKPAPMLPLYRLEEDEELPRLVPVVGRLPLTRADLQAVPFLDEEPPFGIVKFEGAAAWVPIPGWQVVQIAEDPVAILCPSDALPTLLPGAVEDVLVLVDRAQRVWDAGSYFLIEQGEQIQIQWFAELCDRPLLGRVVVILRPKKVLDANYSKDPWQIDE
jgi:Rubisco Assembly chaperone C-terminal domain/Rubisco accumulation factor 1 alpha helical domain/Rubisco accumulation factor 1 helix turn helix domain